MYILECADGSYYTGSTIDLERRLWQHQNGLGAHHTAKRLPVKLVYCEFFERVSDAFKREKQVQGWTRRKKEALMADDSNALHQLAKCQNESHFRRFALLSYHITEGIDNQSSYLSEAEDSDPETI
jgi:putative endonuclease